MAAKYGVGLGYLGIVVDCGHRGRRSVAVSVTIGDALASFHS
jgi:hypothetical protein